MGHNLRSLKCQARTACRVLHARQQGSVAKTTSPSLIPSPIRKRRAVIVPDGLGMKISLPDGYFCSSFTNNETVVFSVDHMINDCAAPLFASPPKVYPTMILFVYALYALSALLAGASTSATSAALTSTPDIPVSHEDTADQWSNTVTIHDPDHNELLGVSVAFIDTARNVFWFITTVFSLP